MLKKIKAMTFKTVSKEKYDMLTRIQKEHPALTFNNEGFEYISKSNLSDADKWALKQVEDILSDSITGFQRFDNFREKSLGEVELRFQYNWIADDLDRISFIGVGYLKLDELYDDETES